MTSSTQPASPLKEDEYALLLYAEQMFLMTRKLPDESLCTEAGHSAATFKRCIRLPVFNLALSQRGIRPYNEIQADGSVSQQLTPEQLNAANVMLDQTDNRSRKKKLTELKISTQKWETWLRDPAFQRYLQARGEAVLGDHSHDAHLALVERVQSGDVGAIKYYNEITGRHIPARDTKGVDVQSILLRVMEIIQRRVTDSNLQMLMADDLIELAKESAGQFNGQPLVGRMTEKPRVIEAPVSKTEGISAF